MGWELKIDWRLAR